MQHPFQILRPEYTTLWQTMRIADPPAIRDAATKLVGLKSRYQPVRMATSVPIAWLAPVDERESDCDPTTYFGNGDPLDRPTTDVPKDRGPWKTWEAGAIDALEYDRINAVTDWCIERMLYEAEAWNGFGPRAHGVHSGYLWAGTQHYVRGKYVKDGVWDASVVDRQIGVAPIIKCMMLIDRSLYVPIVSMIAPVAPVYPQPAPEGLGGDSPDGARWIQAALNGHGQAPPIAVDGNFGKQTRRAVMSFQQRAGLMVDGLVGPKTIAALEIPIA